MSATSNGKPICPYDATALREQVPTGVIDELWTCPLCGYYLAHSGTLTIERRGRS